MATTALIRKLTILRFRGLEKFEWYPEAGMNIVLGGGDVGKSTVLEGIALLLSPSNATVVSESDYWQRDSSKEFMIEAVMALPPATGISTQRNFSWPWGWDGKDAVAPPVSEDDDMPVPGAESNHLPPVTPFFASARLPTVHECDRTETGDSIPVRNRTTDKLGEFNRAFWSTPLRSQRPATVARM